MNRLASFHEDVPMRPAGDFVAVADVESLGVDPDMLERLLVDGPLCFLDFEATGLDPTDDALIEAGAVLVRPGSREAAIFNTFIHTDLVLSPFIKRLTGIAQEDLESAPDRRAVATALDAFIGDVPVVAHNASFERGWLARTVDPRFAKHDFLDTVELLAVVYPDTRNLKLDTFCRGKLARKERHRALDDALDTLRIAVAVIAEARDGNPCSANAYEALRSFRPSSPWRARLANLPGSDVLRDGAAARPAPAAPGAPSPVPFELDAIAERLADEKTAAGVIHGYEFRPAQTELLQRVYDCFAGKNGKTVHVCEAGTGIGKTLAYLAVAIPFARKTGEQVIISTSTKLLQSQLIGKDIPAAARLMGHPDLRFTAMKGRANYLCRARLDGFLDDAASSLPPPDSFPIAYLAAFAGSAGHGEVDRIPPVLYAMHAQMERYRREVSSADATECSRQTCETTRGPCVFREARNRLDGAEVIVVNHDLLLRWPPDYPPLRHLIIDEVHELAERADTAYARSAEGVEIVHRIDAITGDKQLASVAEELTAAGLDRRARELVEAIGEEARSLIGAEHPTQTYRDELAIALDGPGPAWKELVDMCLELSAALESIGHRLADRAENEDSPAVGAAESLLDAASILKDSFPCPPQDLVVRFRGLARQSPLAWRLVATPVSPAADFQFEVLDRVETFFGTSATVSVGEDHRGSLGSLELEERAGSRFRMDPPVDSPFDYEQNLTVLFVDEPTDSSKLIPKTVDTLTTAGLRLGGRTLGLFTSRDRLGKVSDELDASFSSQGITIIAPSSGNADPHDLVRTFVESDHAVLLGARAFWQGLDIPGDACQAVVIEKLPFDVPGDPLIARRSELVEQVGGKAFMDYMLPRMLLRLKQMVGRLIRTPTDRGVVVIVEPRTDRRYFPRLYDALPPRATRRLIKLDELDSALDEFFGAKPD